MSDYNNLSDKRILRRKNSTRGFVCLIELSKKVWAVVLFNKKGNIIDSKSFVCGMSSSINRSVQKAANHEYRIMVDKLLKRAIEEIN